MSFKEFITKLLYGIFIILYGVGFAWSDEKLLVAPASQIIQPEFLPVDEAFKFTAVSLGQYLYLEWQIESGYYLYGKSISLKINEKAIELSGKLPEGVVVQDEYFGKVEVFYSRLELKVQPDDQVTKLEVGYKGCSEAGLCYPQQTRVQQFQ